MDGETRGQRHKQARREAGRHFVIFARGEFGMWWPRPHCQPAGITGRGGGGDSKQLYLHFGLKHDFRRTLAS